MTIRRLAFIVLALSVLGLSDATPSDAGATSSIESTSAESMVGHDDAHAGLSREVRLRKLHLVRPDLIPYPVAYEVHC